MEIMKEIEKKIMPVDRKINFEIGDTVKRPLPHRGRKPRAHPGI